MEYNSQRDFLIMPEYGRNVQKLIRHARTIEDEGERQAFVEEIVELMHQMNPLSKNIDDYRVKLWKHIFRIAEYDLDVDPPIGERPTPESDKKRPDRLNYPKSEARFRHYGNHVKALVNKAIEMEDDDIKEDFVEAIGSYMKLAYQTWNREHYVTDSVIVSDLETLSDGQLAMHDEANLDNLSNKAGKRRRSSGSGSNGGRSKDRGGSRGGRSNRRRKR